MKESVDSGKQLSVKEGEVIYSLYEEQYVFPRDCHSFNEELPYLRGTVRGRESTGQQIGCGFKLEVRGRQDVFTGSERECV